MIKDILKEKDKRPDEILDFILNGIVGVDINPLAVTIARANYLIALGELLRLGKSVILPVYVSDSIRLPEIKTTLSMVQVYEVTVNGYKIQIPCEVAKHRYRFGQILSNLREALNIYRERKSKDEARALFNRKASELASQAELEILNMTLDTLFNLVDKQLNEIWVYMLNNAYAPIALKEAKFDMLTSNPPWIAMRYIENKNYQDWVKDEVLSYGLLTSDQVHLFTQMEIATLFYNRCADLYLEERNGVIAFVMPRSVLTGAFHHANFKEFKKPKLRLAKILDCEDVTPLFNVPSCVLISLRGEKNQYPVLSRRLVGKLEKKNAHLCDALQSLKVEDYAYSPPKAGKKYSEYYDKIKAGAAIYPRCFYFIEFDVHPFLGTIDLRKPLVKTSEDIAEKLPWKGIRLRSNVESNFIYVTMRSSDILPFGYRILRPIVLPIKPHSLGFHLLDVHELKNMGYEGVANWLDMVQKFWEERRTKKAEESFPRVIEALNYQQLLVTQQPEVRYVVLYNKSGTNIASCVIDRKSLPKIKVASAEITPTNFVLEKESCYYESNNADEVHYLCAILNSKIINDAIKPLQPRGLFGERHIVRRPFMLPIPKFDAEDPAHLRLAELSKICHEKVAEAKAKFTGKSVANMRKQAKEVVKEELKEIDELVSKLLNL